MIRNNLLTKSFRALYILCLSLFLTNDSSAVDEADLFPQNLILRSEILPTYISDENLSSIRRVDTKTTRRGHVRKHLYQPKELYKGSPKEQRVNSLELKYMGICFFDLDKKKQIQGNSFGFYSLEFERDNTCFRHEFNYVGKKEGAPASITDVKPDHTKHYPFAGFYQENKPLKMAEQTFFKVSDEFDTRSRIDHPRFIEILVDICPIPYPEGEGPMIYGVEWMRPAFTQSLMAYKYKGIQLKATDTGKVKGTCVEFAEDLIKDPLLLDFPYDHLNQDLHIQEGNPGPVWCLGGFYQEGAALNEYRQSFATFYMEDKKIAHRFSRLEEWWEMGMRPPVDVVKLERGLANAVQTEQYLTLLDRIRLGGARLSLLTGKDELGQKTYDHYRSIEGERFGLTQAFITFEKQDSEKDDSPYKEIEKKIQTEITVLNLSGIYRSSCIKFTLGKEDEAKGFSGKDYLPGAGNPITKALYNGGATVRLVYKNGNRFGFQIYKSYTFKHPDNVYNLVDIYYKPLYEKPYVFEQGIHRALNQRSNPRNRNLERHDLMNALDLEPRGRSLHRSYPRDLSEESSEERRIKTTYFEMGKGNLADEVKNCYEGRKRLFNGELSFGNVGHTLFSCGLDAGYYVNEGIDALTFGGWSWFGDKVEEVAQGVRTKLRRGIRDVSGSQWLGQNVGDYTYLALNLLAPKKVPNTVKFFQEVKLPAKPTRLMESLGLEEQLGAVQRVHGSKANPLNLSDQWTIREGQEWKRKIHGRAQRTGTDGHDFASYRVAVKEAKRPEIDRIHLNHGYNRVTGEKIKSNRRPDVATVDRNGRVNAYEVPSKSDNIDELRHRNNVAMSKLPKHMRGDVELKYIRKGENK